jgi:hypothetical protein
MTKIAPNVTIAEENLLKRNGTIMNEEAFEWANRHVDDADAQTAKRTHAQHPGDPSNNAPPYQNATPFHPMVWFQPHPPPVPFHHSYTFPAQPPPGDDFYERQTTIRHMNTSNHVHYSGRSNPPQSNGRTMHTRPTRPMKAPPPPIVTAHEDVEADLYAALLHSTGGGSAANYGSTAFAANNATGKRHSSNGPSPRTATFNQPPMNTATSRGYYSKPPSRNNSYKNLGGLDALPPPTTPPAISSKHFHPGKAPTHRRANSDGNAAVPRLVIPRSRTPRATVAAANKQLRAAKPDVPLPSFLNAGASRRASGSAIPSPRRLPGGSSNSVGGASKPGHRRGSSGMSHYSAASYAGTEASMMSIVSDIRQSAFFGGVNERTGKVQMHFPTSNVHLIPIDRTRVGHYDPQFQIGRIYQVAVDDEDYEDYHRAADDGASWSLEDYDDDSMMSEIGIDGDYYRTSSPRKFDHPACKCPQCTFHRSAAVLGPGYYCLTVDDTIYQRVLDEVCASQTMPCGLFFCGHHEDVSRPSIWIPATIVLLLLSVMAWVAYSF